MFFRVGLLWSIAAILLLAAVSPPLQAQDYIPLDGLRVSDGRVQFGFASAGQCIQLSNSNINGVVYTTHTSKWQRRTGSSWVDIPGTERNGLCSYSPTSLGEYRLVAEISINGERGHYSSENTLTVEGAPGGTGPAGTESFSFPDLGGWFATSSGTEETVRVGYGRISADVGSTTPSGIAIFQYRDSQGVLIAEASVPATELIQEGRIFAEVEGPVNTGLAIANPNDVPATIRFYFTDTTGTNLGSGNFELGEHEQTAKFLNQEPFNEALPDGSPVLGTFTFESSVPIAVIALRGFTNEADEFLMTTLPVAPLSPASEETVYIPHFAAGGGWVTQVILVNPTDSTIAGTVGFLGPGSGTAAASPVILTLGDGSTGSDFDYSIPPRSSQRFTTSNPFGALNSGSVRAVPDSGNAAPSGLVVFSYAPAGKTLSEAGVPALPKGSAFRVYAEASGMLGQMGSISTGLAITNVGNTSNTVTLEVTHLDGSLAAAPEMLTLPPSGQMARFLNDIFSLPGNFSGVLRVTSTADIAIVALRLRVNENGEIKVTTLAPSNEMDPPASESSRFFAHIADSGGWSTQFILFSGTAGQAASGTLSFIDTAGQPWDLTTDSGVSGSVPPSGGAYADLVLASASVSSATPMAGQPFELRANVDNRGTGASTATTLRFYRSTDTTISSIDTEVGTDAVSALAAGGTSSSVLMLTALSTAGTYYYGACVDPVSGESNSQNNCSSAVRVTISASQMESSGFDLANENGNAEGIVFANDRFYVVDDDDKVYAYQATGQRDSASDFDLAPDNSNGTGITFANDRFYVVDSFDEKVYAYDASGQHDPGADFDLASDNSWPHGITFANDRLYVVDLFAAKVYGYQASGQRDSASDFDLAPDNSWPYGITFANGQFYVVDWFDDKVYAYSAGTASGTTGSQLNFGAATATRLIPENLPGGINVGAPVSAVGGDALKYAISGTDARSFVIVPDTGQIRTREGVTYDYETKSRYFVTVGVEDDSGNRDTIDVTIRIKNLAPACEPPSNFRVNYSDERLTLRWGPLSDTSGYARVLGYETEIRRVTSGAWSDRRTFLGRNIGAMIYAGLDNEIEYQVRVRPINAEGDCSWSTPVSGIPTADRAPEDDDDHHDRFGPYPVGTPERNLRLLTPGRCRHTSNGQTLDADCDYENTGPDSGRIFLEFDDPSQGSCEITLAYSSLTAGSFIDECFDAGVNTNVPFDRSFRMPPLSEQDGEVEVPRAPRSQEEFDVLAWSRDDFIPGLGFGCPPVFVECELSLGDGYTVGLDKDTGQPHYVVGKYAYMNTGPTTGVLTFRDDFGSSYTFALEFGGSGSMRATIEAPGGASVWPGMPHLDLTLGALPVLLPIPPSWSAAIAIETDVAPDDWDGLEDRIPTPRSPVHPISPRDSLLVRTLFEGWANAVAGGGDYENMGLSYTFGYEKLGRNRVIISFDFREQFTDDYDEFDQLQQTLIGSIWVFDLTFTSDGAAKYTLTIKKDGHLPTVLEGVVDFHGDGISVDEFPEELLLPDNPPQASGEDVSGVEVAAAITTTRIDGDDVQTFLASDSGATYRPGDWLEPKDGSNQRMMIVGASQVSAVASAALSPDASPQFGPQILKTQTAVSSPGSPQFATAMAPFGVKASPASALTSSSTITQVSVVCMQIGQDIPTRGARYFSQPKTAQDPVQLCQQKCVLDGRGNIQACVWRCEANAAGN